MLDVVRPYALKDIETIKKLTGERDIRYYDIAYLKEKIKGTLLTRDANNIEMLTCFTLQNVMKGLMILASEVFGQKIELKTLILTIEGGKTHMEELNGYQLHQNTLRGLREN